MRRLHVYRSAEVYEDRMWGVLGADWTNVMHSRLPYPRAGSFQACDIRRGLPFEDGAFETAYVPHVLEHLDPDEAAAFARDLHRVLVPGAVVRLTTPDLERAARHYLETLEAAATADDAGSQERYDWGVYELIDQLVRRQSGGRMLRAFRGGRFDESDMVERFGEVFRHLNSPRVRTPRGTGPKAYAYAAARRVKRRWLGSDPRRTLEAVAWMWDRVSLVRLLTEAGFDDSRQVGPGESAIPDWERYDFDRTHEGLVLEPSVYVEAVR